jgi:maltose alpha-D-glucosyltransferase/alpha-amylase
MLCVANLSRSAQAAELDLTAWKGRVPEEMLGRTDFRQISDQPYVVTLAPYGFFWLRLREPSERAVRDTVTHVPEWVTLVFSDGWRSLGKGRTRQVLENDVLPPFLVSRRWFAHKNSGAIGAQLHAAIPLAGDEGSVITIVDVTAGNDTARYALPLMVQWARFDRSFDHAKSAVVAPVRRANREGVLIDAVGEQNLVGPIVTNLHDNATLGSDGLQLAFRASHKFAEAPPAAIESVRVVNAEQSNSTVMINSAYVLKFYRRISQGPSAEFEIGRFLTDATSFANSPALLGTVELIENGVRFPLAVMHEFVENQGDAWAFTGAYLDRALDEERVLTAEPEPAADKHAAFENRIRQIGRRVGELHAALASRADIAVFAPEPITRADLAAWTERLAGQASEIFEKLARSRDRLDEKSFGAIDELLTKRDLALERIRSLLPADIEADKIRHHADLHLGQVLIVKDDAVIIDFEGEPQRSPSERTLKAPSARDVAGIIRSLDYAATAALHRIVKAPVEEMSKLDAYLDQWRTKSAIAFYAGVRETIGPGRLWPSDEDAARRLLRFFVAEKAIYEIGYELANRPEWIAVPVAGACRVLFGNVGSVGSVGSDGSAP